MSMKVIGPSQQGFGLGSGDLGHMDAFKGGGGHRQNGGQPGGQVSFGGPSALGAQNAQVNFGGQPAQLSDSRVGATQKAAEGGDNQLSSQVRDLVQQILQLIAQMMQNNQNGAGSGSGNGTGNGSGSGAQNKAAQPVSSASPASNAAEQPAATAGAGSPSAESPAAFTAENAQQPSPSTDQAQAPQAAAPETASTSASTANDATTAATSTGDAPTAGTGPRSFNITNTQDHPIKIGQFDQHDNLTAELTLEPGQKGTMKFENDTTGLLKQADADGKYQPDASRLEFYNGFINTSDIDGRNASIHATDGKGFEIGDSQSVADKASSDIVSTDSAGDKTVAGYYDGSTDAMKKGGEFLTQTLGTDMTYMHPNDDTLGQGKNPMRHTDSMSLDVTFGKA
jgi:hypothetical protein